MSQKNVENQLWQLLVQCLELKYDVEIIYLVKLLQVLKISQVSHQKYFFLQRNHENRVDSSTQKYEDSHRI
jgi:hypothetical protein